jgi:hypothetical protein
MTIIQGEWPLNTVVLTRDPLDTWVSLALTVASIGLGCQPVSSARTDHQPVCIWVLSPAMMS